MTTDRLLRVPELGSYTGPPLYLFIGISTAGSSIHHSFPGWAPILAPGSVVRGLDLPPDASRDTFRRVLAELADNPHIRGAVITSHKLRVHDHCADLFDSRSLLVDLAHEVNCVSTTDGVRAFATDPLALDLVIDDVRPGRARREGQIVCLGSGGSAAALLLAYGLDIRRSLAADAVVPPATRAGAGHLTIVGRREAGIAPLAELSRLVGSADRVGFVVAADAAARGRVTAAAGSGSLIINATGLGKTEPGSPLAGAQAFPERAVAWDFNYRGPLTFLTQASEAGATVVDGWEYFLAGWSTAFAAMEGQDPIDVLRRVRAASQRPSAGNGV